jgi:hypothetical protein
MPGQAEHPLLCNTEAGTHARLTLTGRPALGRSHKWQFPMVWVHHFIARVFSLPSPSIEVKRSGLRGTSTSRQH